MPADLALLIVTAVASALDYAHKKGLNVRPFENSSFVDDDVKKCDEVIEWAKVFIQQTALIARRGV